jgi:fermentation-respiration switch protein FrsA (DUF1100 family)
MLKEFYFYIGTQKLVGNLHLPEHQDGPFPCVITSHGYKSRRDSSKYIKVGHFFSLAGIAVFRFDHRGALGGDSDGKFEDTTLSARIEDLRAALDALVNISELNLRRLGLLGSSLGGMDVLAIRDERIKAKVIMATPFKLLMTDQMKSVMMRKEYYQYPDGTRINKDFFKDMEQHDLITAAKDISYPLLIIHGDLDEIVPLTHAEVIYKAARHGNRSLKIIKGGDHTFRDPNRLEEVLIYSREWFQRYL